MTRHQRGRAQVVRASGVLGPDEAGALAEHLAAAARVDEAVVVLDFLDVDAIDASVVRALTQHLATMDELERPTVLIAEHPQVLRMLELTGLAQRYRTATARHVASELGYYAGR